MNQDIKVLSTSIADLSIAVNTLNATATDTSKETAPIINSTLLKVLIVLGTTVDNLSVIVNKETVSKDQLKLALKTPVTEKKEVKVIKLKPTDAPKSEIKPEKTKVEEKKTAESKTLSASDLFTGLLETTKKTIRDSKNLIISSEIESTIKKEITKEYAKLHPEHSIATDLKERDLFYLTVLCPQAIEDLKKEGLKEITPEDTVEKTNPSEESPVSEKETKKKSEADLSPADKVKNILAAVGNGAKVTSQKETPKEVVKPTTEGPIEKKSTEDSDKTPVNKEINTTTDAILTPQAQAAIILEQTKDLDATPANTIAPKVQELCKVNFAKLFAKQKEKSIKIEDKDFNFVTYTTALLKEMKSIGGGVENAPHVKMGNKGLLKTIKKWQAELLAA